MKDNPEFNVKFVALMEKHPCIFDHTSPDYSRKLVQDKAWETVAKELSAKVEDCKERWKNLRACYTRHLKMLSRPVAKRKRPYYLADHLHFLQPFTKSREFKYGSVISNSKSWNDSNDEPDPEDDPETERAVRNANAKTTAAGKRSADKVSEATASKKANIDHDYPLSIVEVNGSATEYFEPKKTPPGIGADSGTDDPDLLFFKSLLPDMKDMNKEQKRRFKIGIMNLAGEILSEYQSPGSPEQMTESSYVSVVNTACY